MTFYWKDKKDQVSHFLFTVSYVVVTKLSQLYVRRGTVGGAVDAWTTFHMTLREPGPMPPAFDLTRFLVSSITFMTHLSEVSVYFDDKRLVKLSKNRGVSKNVPMLKDLKGMSPEGMMNVKSIKTTREFKFCFSSGRIYVLPLAALHLKAEVVGLVYKVGSEKPSVASNTDILKSSSHKTSGFFSPLPDGFKASSTRQGTSAQVPVVHKESINLLDANSSKIVLSIFSANIDVRVDKKMARELVRATKKKPPNRLRYEFIYVSFTVVTHILKMGSYSCTDGEGRV
jgi:hypothetical protein